MDGMAEGIVIGDLRTSRRAAILEEFRESGEILELFHKGVEELKTLMRNARGSGTG